MCDALLLENFNLDVISEFEDIYTEDGIVLADQWITEAQEGANKKNIFQKLWDLIKKFFSWIAKKLSQLWKWLVSKFKKKSKTADQCVMEVIGEEPLKKPAKKRSPAKKNAPEQQPVVKPESVKTSEHVSSKSTTNTSVSKRAF